MADAVGAQWAACVRNMGAWEGSLARYEPDGTFVERTPTVLFIYTDSKDDAARVAAGGVPYRLDLMLRRAARQSDAKQMCAYTGGPFPPSPLPLWTMRALLCFRA